MALRFHQRFLQRGYLAYSRLSRGMTLGVRALLLKDDHVVLVKHSYVPGWYLPGGGVEPGETVAEAVTREVLEEAGVLLTGPPSLFAVYRNAAADRRDHVALFVCREFESGARPRRPGMEIVACERFPLTALPQDATVATMERIREVLNGESPPADW